MTLYACYEESHDRFGDGVGEFQFQYEFFTEPSIGDTINAAEDEDKPRVWTIARRHWRHDGSCVLLLSRPGGQIIPAVR